MNKQMTMSQISDELANAKTSKRDFLGQIERIVPITKRIPSFEKGKRKACKGLDDNHEVKVRVLAANNNPPGCEEKCARPSAL